jgi:hypothetical protein
MLPRNDEVVRTHATMNSSDAKALDAFMEANPHLAPVEWDGRSGQCQGLWHISFLGHRENAGRDEVGCCQGSNDGYCLVDHDELWQDRVTKDLVFVSHPYTDPDDPPVDDEVDFLREKRGLHVAMSTASWYYPGSTSLVVLARPRTLARVEFGDDLVRFDNWSTEWDTKKVVAMQMAWEQVEAERWTAEAANAESEGDFERAVLLYVDSAHTDRTGRFHRRATQALREAGRLLVEHYEDAVELVATRSFLTNAETRNVFGFAGMAVPDFIEKIWKNKKGQNSSQWGYRYVKDQSDENHGEELYRCTVCEEWMVRGERVLTVRIGMVHKGQDCFRKAAGLAAKAPAPEMALS